MKIAIASSGLGHISRGVETWARDTADALHALGVDVTLFSGAPLPERANGAPQVAIPCIRRFSLLSRVLVRMLPGFAWRWGLKSGYGLEQLTFWWNLRRKLKYKNGDPKATKILTTENTEVTEGENRGGGKVESRNLISVFSVFSVVKKIALAVCWRWWVREKSNVESRNSK